MALSNLTIEREKERPSNRPLACCQLTHDRQTKNRYVCVATDWPSGASKGQPFSMDYRFGLPLSVVSQTQPAVAAYGVAVQDTDGKCGIGLCQHLAQVSGLLH